MNKKVWFDVDGVMRDLNILVQGGDPVDYTSKIGKKTYNEYVTNKLDILLNAPPTIYFPVICEYLKTVDVNIITCQPTKWVPNTLAWLDNHLNVYGISNYHITIVSQPLEKESYVNRNELIVEDYPFFSKKMKNKVLLIDKPYNQCTINYLHRIRTPDELRRILNEI
jgi:hypothetical protein